MKYSDAKTERLNNSTLAPIVEFTPKQKQTKTFGTTSNSTVLHTPNSKTQPVNNRALLSSKPINAHSKEK